MSQSWRPASCRSTMFALAAASWRTLSRLFEGIVDPVVPEGQRVNGEVGQDEQRQVRSEPRALPQFPKERSRRDCDNRQGKQRVANVQVRYPADQRKENH